MKKQDEKQLHSSAEDFPVSRSQQPEHRKVLPIFVTSGLKWQELFPNCTPLGCLGRMLPDLSVWGSTKRFFDLEREGYAVQTYVYPACGVGAWHERARTFIVAVDVSRHLHSDNTNNKKDAMRMNVFLSESGIFRKKNPNGRIWSLPLSAAVFYLTPIASDGIRSNFKPEVLMQARKSANLATQIIQQEMPMSDKSASTRTGWNG